MTDYIALVTRFAAAGAIGELDAIDSFWTSDVASGLAETSFIDWGEVFGGR